MRLSLGMKGTFLLALAGFSALMAAGLATVWAYRVTSDLREQVEQRGESLTASLAVEAARVLHIEDSLERELSLMLLTHRLAGEVVYAQVVHRGAVVSQSGGEAAAALEPLSWPLREPVRERTVDGAPVLEFVQLLPEDEPPADPSRRSYVRLGLSLEQVREKVRRTLVDVAAVALAFTAAGAAVAYGLYSAILVPLERVIASIRRLQAGDLEARAHVASYPELKELADAFNRMAEEIGRRNEELQRVNAELRSANEAKSQFLAMVGHELKTPLHSVRGYCQMLLEELGGPLTPEQRADIEAVLASGNHLLALIDNLLHFSASGAEALHKTPVDLAALLQQAADYVRPLAHRKGLYVRVDTAGLRAGELGAGEFRASDFDAGGFGKPAAVESRLADAVWVDVDGTKLRQVLINLLHNAVKYTGQGGVEVRARREGSELVIEVSDTGPGIPPGERERIFEPFERLERAGGEEWKGLGLGLAIARRYVAAHGGSIEAGDAPGGGACFTLRFPAIFPERRNGFDAGSPGGRRSGSPQVAYQIPERERV